MDKEDARFQKLEQLHERRKQVVRLHLRGTAVMEIAALTGLSYPTVRKAIDLFVVGGWSAIKPAPRGRSAGDGRLLSAAQEASVRRTICDKRPEQLKMEFALWTRGASQFSAVDFGVVADSRHRPVPASLGLHAPEADQARLRAAPRGRQAVARSEYPAIDVLRQGRGGEIHWGDETALVNTDVRGRSYAPRARPQ